VPKTSSGTGDAQARAVYDGLRDWKLDGKVEGMCFDTSSIKKTLGFYLSANFTVTSFLAGFCKGL